MQSSYCTGSQGISFNWLLSQLYTLVCTVLALSCACHIETRISVSYTNALYTSNMPFEFQELGNNLLSLLKSVLTIPGLLLLSRCTCVSPTDTHRKTTSLPSEMENTTRVCVVLQQLPGEMEIYHSALANCVCVCVRVSVCTHDQPNTPFTGTLKTWLNSVHVIDLIIQAHEQYTSCKHSVLLTQHLAAITFAVRGQSVRRFKAYVSMHIYIHYACMHTYWTTTYMCTEASIINYDYP